MSSSVSYVIVTFILQDGDMSNSIRVPLHSAGTAAETDGAATKTDNKTAPTLRRIAKDAMRRFVIMRRRNDNPRMQSLSEALRRAANKQIAVTEMFVGVKDEPQAEVFPNDLVTHVVQLDKEVIFLKLVILPAEAEAPGETARLPSPQSNLVGSQALLKGSSDTLAPSRTSSAPAGDGELDGRVPAPHPPSLLEEVPSNETTTSVPLAATKENSVHSQGTALSSTASVRSRERSPAPFTPPKRKPSPKSRTASQKKRSRTKEVAPLSCTDAVTAPKRLSVERYETPSLSASHSHTREGSSPPVLTVNVFSTQTKSAADDGDHPVDGNSRVADVAPPGVARQLQFPTSDNSTPGETAKEPSVEFIASHRSSRSNHSKSKTATPAKQQKAQTTPPGRSPRTATGNKTLPHRADGTSPQKSPSTSSRKPRRTPTKEKNDSTAVPSSAVSKALFQTSPVEIVPGSQDTVGHEREVEQPDDSPGIRPKRNVQLPSYFAELFRPKASDYTLKCPFTSGKY